MLNDKQMQAIIDKVIAAGHYPCKFKEGVVSSNYMCFSLLYAAQNHVITDGEYIAAKRTIDAYIAPYGRLQEFLIAKNEQGYIEHRLALYKNWANRPLGVGHDI